ncbi:MAG: peptidylprolyl isomerase [Bacillota bacterium]|nr:MAG: peptidylprolyl isomerase [Bacillota bacterium]
MADESVGETRRDTVTIKTSKGDIVLKLYPDLMPVTVANFEKLARAGFYSNLVWHRVEDWVVQTGDPTGTGRGGSGESIRLETHPKLLNRRGGVGMARGEDPDSATSQFYILREDASWLDGKYALFGYVVDGMGAVDRLVAGDMLLEVSVEQEPAGGR